MRYVRCKQRGIFLTPDTYDNRPGLMPTHETVAKTLCIEVISAGYVTVDASGVHVYGYSSSLGKKPLPDDPGLIAIELGMVSELNEDIVHQNNQSFLFE